MATDAANYSVHNTLTSTTVDTVTINAPHTRLRISNRHASVEMWVTISLTGAVPADPTSAGDNTHYVAPGTSRFFYSRGGVIVKILGNANPYSVEGEAGGVP